ncbi:MAG TPA: FHA domain-containing protein [Phycisphaerales bacterium]|nr:FHA domain-containing protein [Phycisphaerales bacterium]
MYELSVCTNNGDVLRRFDLSRLAKAGKRIRVGRAEDCDIRIKNDSVSRHHCEIEPLDEDEWVIRDTNSTAGVVVDGRKVTEAEIESGLVVHIGPAVLRFVSLTAKIAADLERELGSEE